MAQEYINWYKVGKIKQYAQKNKIDIDKLIAYEEIRASKQVTKTWTEKIEAELSKELKDIDEIEETNNEKRKLASKCQKNLPQLCASEALQSQGLQRQAGSVLFF